MIHALGFSDSLFDKLVGLPCCCEHIYSIDMWIKMVMVLVLRKPSMDHMEKLLSLQDPRYDPLYVVTAILVTIICCRHWNLQDHIILVKMLKVFT